MKEGVWNNRKVYTLLCMCVCVCVCVCARTTLTGFISLGSESTMIICSMSQRAASRNNPWIITPSSGVSICIIYRQEEVEGRGGVHKGAMG